MASDVPNIPFAAPIASSSGLLSPAWSGFFLKLYQRIGGTTADTNVELANAVVVNFSAVNAAIAALQTLTTTQAGQITDLQTNFYGLGVGRQL